jgi:PhoH-like ATPase
MSHKAPSNNKTYVLDTSVLLSSPNALFNFDEHEVVIPIVVLKELEEKRDHPTLGYNARAVLRALENIRNVPGNDLRKGVIVNDSGGTLRIEINHVDTSHLPEAIKADKSNDTRILSVANALSRDGEEVTVVSKDLPMRLLAHGALGIPAEEYRGEQAQDSGYTGIASIDLSKDKVDELYETGHVAHNLGLPENTGVIINSGYSSALGKINGDRIVLVRGDRDVFGISGRSAEQRIALSHLMNTDIGIVSVGGPAGTGKSVLALAAALESVLEQKQAKKIIVFRPVFSVGGQELGFLPGTEQEKMSPFTAAITDALEAITSESVIDEVMSRGLLEILPLTYVRGRTLTDSIVILDEAQNLERSTILTAISRLGENSRIFMTHDVAQRDNLRVGRYDGVAAVVERLKGEPLFAHVALSRSERSPIAALATKLLDDFLPET